MKKPNLKPEKVMLKFVEPKCSRRIIIQEPFVYNGYVYATDGKTLIRFKANRELPNSIEPNDMRERFVAIYLDSFELPKAGWVSFDPTQQRSLTVKTRIEIMEINDGYFATKQLDRIAPFNPEIREVPHNESLLAFRFDIYQGIIMCVSKSDGEVEPIDPKAAQILQLEKLEKSLAKEEAKKEKLFWI